MSNKKITLEITGMTCDHCAATIKKFLSTLPGINADVSFQNKEAIIAINDDTSVDIIITTIETAGFKAIQK